MTGPSELRFIICAVGPWTIVTPDTQMKVSVPWAIWPLWVVSCGFDHGTASKDMSAPQGPA